MPLLKYGMRVRDIDGRQWIIERKLGEGGMAIAWMAIREDDGAYGVIKEPILNGGQVINIAGLNREVEVLYKLSHSGNCPGVVRLLSYVTWDGQILMPILEYVDGPSLKSWIQDVIKVNYPYTTIPVPLLKVAKRLAQAVKCLHDNCIIHRDIRPANVIIRNNIEPVIIDFSTARSCEREDGWVVESPGGYTPLELTMGRSSFKTDLWSLGATMIYMFTGNDPIIYLDNRRNIDCAKLRSGLSAITPDPLIMDVNDLICGMMNGDVDNDEIIRGLDKILLTPYIVQVEVIFHQGIGDAVNYGNYELAISEGNHVIIGRGAKLRAEVKPNEGRFIIHDPFGYVSKNHCRLSIIDGALYVEDLGSTNGTALRYPNGTWQPITPRVPTPLCIGCSILLTYRGYEDEPYVEIRIVNVLRSRPR